MRTRTLTIFFFVVTLTAVMAASKDSKEEDDDEDRPFSIGLGVLAPSYSQRLGKDGKTRLDFKQDENGFSYSVGNGDPKDSKNFFKQYQTVNFNNNKKAAPAPQNEVGRSPKPVQHSLPPPPPPPAPTPRTYREPANNQRDLANAAQTYRDSGYLSTAGVSPYGNNAGAYRGYNEGVREGPGSGSYGGVASSHNRYQGHHGEADRNTFASLAAIRTPEFDRFFQSGLSNNQLHGAPSRQNNVQGYTRTYNGPADGVLAFAQAPVLPRFNQEFASAGGRHLGGGGGGGGGGGYGRQQQQNVAGGNYGNDFRGAFGGGQGQQQGQQGFHYGGVVPAAATRQQYGSGGGGGQGQALSGFDASGFPPIPGYDPNAPPKAASNVEDGQYRPQHHQQPQQQQAVQQQQLQVAPRVAIRRPVYPQGGGGGGQGQQVQGQQFAFSNQGSYGPRGTYGAVGHAAREEYRVPIPEVPTYQSQIPRGRPEGAPQGNLIGVSFGDPKNPYGGAFNYGGTITHAGAVGGGGAVQAAPIAHGQGGGQGGQQGGRGRA